MYNKEVTDEGGASIIADTVEAKIIFPNNDEEIITLLETETGKYEGLFENANQEGSFNIIVTAQKSGYESGVVGFFFDVKIEKIPLGKDKQCNISAMYRIYVPTRWGGDLTVATSEDEIELYYPDPETKVDGPDIILHHSVLNNEHGWYYVKYLGDDPTVISNLFTQQGEANKRPWNFWYWPFADWKDPNLYDDGGVLEKYDALFGTTAKDYEKQNFSSGDSWWGHCLGGSIASILLPQPEDTNYRSFTQEEIEGLVVKLGNTFNFVADTAVGGIPAVKPVAGSDNADAYVARFHNALVKYIRDGNKVLQSNLRQASGTDAAQVWNHGVYKYISNMEEALGDDENIITISTTLHSNSDHYPSGDSVDRTDSYVYKLKYNSGSLDFMFSGNDWISASGFTPYNLYYISDCEFDGRLKYNPQVKKDKVENLGITFP